MRRSFGPGMGSGGGGMMKTVHRAVRAGFGGGSSPEPYSHSATTTSNISFSSNTNINPSSPRSNYLNQPVPAAPLNWTSPTASEEFDWECIDGGESVNGVVYDDIVFGSVPSKEEVHQALSSLQEVVHDLNSFSQLIKDGRKYDYEKDGVEKMLSPTSCHKFGSELDWIEPSMQLWNSTSTLQVPRVYDAFHLLQTEPSVQRMVISLSSDKAVWDAVMNNEVVRELRESVNEVDENISDEGSEDNNDGSNPVTKVLRWILVNTKEKAIEIVEKITKLVNELVQPVSKKPKREDGGVGPDSFEEKLTTSFLLSVMVLLIVVVSRARKC